MNQTERTITGLEKFEKRLKRCHKLEHDEEMISQEELEAVPSAIRILRATNESAQAGVKELT